MIQKHLPVLFGLVTALTLISSTMLIYHLIGFSRGDALYLACLTFVGVASFISRRALRKSGGK